MVYTGLEIVRHQHDGGAAEILEHIHMGMNPVFRIHPQTAFCIGIHTERQHTDEKADRNCFAGISVNDVQLVSCPVYLNSVTRLSGDVHGSAFLLGKLLEVEAELRIHEGLFTQLTALLAVLHPEKLEDDATPGQFFGYLLKVRHPAQRYMLLLLRKQQPLQVRICFHIQRPDEIGCTSSLKNRRNGAS